MIGKKVEYSKVENDLIKEYLQQGNVSGDDWSHKKFEAIKDTIKKHYKNEQEYTCPYCKIKYPVTHGMVWDIEHIIAKDSKPNFMFEPLNLCVSCKDCNGSKSNTEVLVNKKRKTFPKKNTDYKIVHPHFDVYDEHINAIVPGDFYRALSKKGEFTIIECRLLRFYGAVNKEQPDQEINDLAKALINAEGFARELIERELSKKLEEKAKKAP